MSKGIYEECPICMNEINTDYNKVVTNCKHTFHCICLMENVKINGYSCPCCRTNINENNEKTVNLEKENIFTEVYNTNVSSIYTNEEIYNNNEELYNTYEEIYDRYTNHVVQPRSRISQNANREPVETIIKNKQEQGWLKFKEDLNNIELLTNRKRKKKSNQTSEKPLIKYDFENNYKEKQMLEEKEDHMLILELEQHMRKCFGKKHNKKIEI
jgi:hypothetical protein